MFIISEILTIVVNGTRSNNELESLRYFDDTMTGPGIGRAEKDLFVL